MRTYGVPSRILLDHCRDDSRPLSSNVPHHSVVIGEVRISCWDASLKGRRTHLISKLFSSSFPLDFLGGRKERFKWGVGGVFDDVGGYAGGEGKQYQCETRGDSHLSCEIWISTAEAKRREVEQVQKLNQVEHVNFLIQFRAPSLP